MGEQTGGARPPRTGGSAALLLGAWSSLVGCGRKPLAQGPRLGRSRSRSSLTYQFSPQTSEEDVRKAPCCGRGALILSSQTTLSAGVRRTARPLVGYAISLPALPVKKLRMRKAKAAGASFLGRSHLLTGGQTKD